MRARLLRGAGLALLALLAACRASDPVGTPFGEAGAPPPRTVVPADGPILPLYDARAPKDPDDDPPDDPPPPPYLDAGPGGAGGGQGGASGSADAARADGRPAGGCDLLRQDCPPELACYPGRGGGGVCEPVEGGVGLPAGADCAEHSQCARRHACIQNVCRAICDLEANECPQGSTCADQGSYRACTP